jgi:hypothetical protein
MIPNAGGRGGVAGVSANEYSCTLWRSHSIFNLWVTAINSADSPILILCSSVSIADSVYGLGGAIVYVVKI